MAFGKLEELKLTEDEMSRFAEALRDARFRELLREYATEISDPENQIRYEREIERLESERGSAVRFIHPEPHHVLKARGAGGKSFINICTDPLIGAPESEAARDRGGRTGLRWRLPYCLTPGRADRDSRGRACMVYDVVFHPHALRMAETSARLMKLVHDTAIRGLRDSFGVEITEHGVKRLKLRCKGTPQLAVIRRAEPDPKQSPPETQQELKTEPEPDVEADTAQPITPRYRLKYRSLVDLQDFRLRQECGPGARPAQVLLEVELPLLRAAADAELHVEDQLLRLHSRSPAYSLELRLAYPVDEHSGTARFNSTRRLLTVTLPVRPQHTETPAHTPQDHTAAGTVSEPLNPSGGDGHGHHVCLEPDSQTEVVFPCGTQRPEPHSGALCLESEPHSGAPHPESEPHSGAPHPESEPHSGAPHPESEPHSGALCHESEPHSGASCPESEPHSGALRPESEPHSGALRPESEPHSGALHPESEPHSGALHPESEPHSGALRPESEPHSGALRPESEPHSGALSGPVEPHTASLAPLLNTLRFQLD